MRSSSAPLSRNINSVQFPREVPKSGCDHPSLFRDWMWWIRLWPDPSPCCSVEHSQAELEDAPSILSFLLSDVPIFLVLGVMAWKFVIFTPRLWCTITNCLRGRILFLLCWSILLHWLWGFALVWHVSNFVTSKAFWFTLAWGDCYRVCTLLWTVLHRTENLHAWPSVYHNNGSSKVRNWCIESILEAKTLLQTSGVSSRRTIANCKEQWNWFTAICGNSCTHGGFCKHCSNNRHWHSNSATNEDSGSFGCPWTCVNCRSASNKLSVGVSAQHEWNISENMHSLTTYESHQKTASGGFYKSINASAFNLIVV